MRCDEGKRGEGAPKVAHLNVAGPGVLGVESVEGVVEDET